MSRIFSSILLVLLAIGFTQCRKELSYVGGPDPEVNTPSPVKARLYGNVFDENDQPAAGVTVKVGQKTAVTNQDGYFMFELADLDRMSSLATAELNGYFKAFRVFTATKCATYIEFKLTKRNLAGTINSVTGGEVTLSNGAKVQLAANGVIDPVTNSPYTGTVNVYAAYIDPTANDISRTVPGSFQGRNLNNGRVLLASYGMMAVELATPSGQKLQVRQGFASKLTTPIPASLQATAPSHMPMWYIDEFTGLWMEEGMATKSGNVYVADVKHYTYWNCDIPLSNTQIEFQLKTQNGNVLPFTYVRIVRQSNPLAGMVHGITDSAGVGNPLVPSNEPLILQVYPEWGCNTPIYTQNIGPFSQPTNIGIITLPISVSTNTINGNMQNCSGGAVTEGYALIKVGYKTVYAAVNANGEFSTSYIACPGGPATFSFTGVDAGNNQQGATQNIPLTAPVTTVSNYAACGVSSQQYINYTVNGTSYTITGLGTDSLAAWTGPEQGTTLLSTYIGGFNMFNTNQFSFRFLSSATVPGTYALTTLYVNNMQNISGGGGLSVNITQFAQTPMDFYEGNLSGTFVHNGQPQTVTANFRVRRLF